MNILFKTYFSKTVLLSPFILFLLALHLVCVLSKCLELYADEQDYGYMLYYRLPIGFLLILGTAFVFTICGFWMAKSKLYGTQKG